VATERTARLSASPPLFRNRFLDFFSRVHPAVPALLYIPVITALVVLGANDGQGALELALLVFAGLAIWTISEYWLHRKVFHWDPDHPIGHRLHFIIHGVHHDHPNDKMRLVMPPGASIPLAALFFGLFWLVFGLPAAYPLFAGFLIGYLIYDYMHYYLHHFVPKSELGKRLREQHMRHHFQDHRYGFGVSSPLWDVVFRTLPKTRRSESRPSTPAP
jgi:sterol desaturase/sphingolipid hydroxylase (fatty acid hydroxylase superfamily)